MTIEAGTAIRRRRERWGMTPADLARRADVPPRRIHEIERGDACDAILMRKLDDALRERARVVRGEVDI